MLFPEDYPDILVAVAHPRGDVAVPLGRVDTDRARASCHIHGDPPTDVVPVRLTGEAALD